MKQSLKITGFTLIELIVTLTIAAILATIAVPSFFTTIKNNRAAAHINEFVTALNVARSEAIKRGVRITLCKSSDNDSCDTSSTGWEQGWIVFIDTDSDQIHDAGETILLASTGLASGTTLIGDATSDVKNFVSYRSSGTTTFPVSGGEARLILCDERNDATKTKAIGVAPTGRIRSMPASASGLSCS